MWKKEYQQLRERFDDFWKGKGFILSMWNGYFPTNHTTRLQNTSETEQLERLLKSAEEQDDWASFYLNGETVALYERHNISKGFYPGDLIPFAYCDWGTVTLAPMLGSEQHFSKDTVWYTCKNNPISPEIDRHLILDDQDWWFLNLQELARTGKRVANGNYWLGSPAIFGGLDVLSELRGASQLCMDLVLEPMWVHQKLKEIDEAAKKAYHTIYEIVKDDEGAMFHAFFMFWARGKASLHQCDFAALISEDMFREFAIPSIQKACSYLDYTLYHVDGPEALRTVDALLEVEELNCLEFTPGPQVPQGGDPRWYPLYKKIKEAGKCVQVVEMKANEVIPLLNAVGPDGLYLMVNFRDEQEIVELNKAVEKFR